MSRIIKTKKQFMELVSNCRNPELVEGSESYDLINTYFVIRCSKTRYGFGLRGCRLTPRQFRSKYVAEHIKDFYQREVDLRSKYNRWIKEYKDSLKKG